MGSPSTSVASSISVTARAVVRDAAPGSTRTRTLGIGAPGDHEHADARRRLARGKTTSFAGSEPNVLSPSSNQKRPARLSQPSGLRSEA